MTPRFWIYPLLVISLAFNLAVVIVHFLMPPPPPPPHGPEAYRDRIVHDMDGPDAATVRAVFDKHHAEFLARRRAADEAAEGVRSALAAEPLNMNVLETALAKARMARTSQQQVMEETIVDAAKQISPEGRKALVPPPAPMHDRGDEPPMEGPHGPPPGPPPPP